MKREAELNEMFASMREEKPDISVKKVHKWLGISGGVVLSVYLLSWIKRVLFLKPVVMISSVIALGSLTFVTLFSTGNVAKENQVTQSAYAVQEAPSQQTDTKEVTPPAKPNQPEKPETPSKPEPIGLSLPIHPIFPIEPTNQVNFAPLTPPVVSKMPRGENVGDFTSLHISSAFHVLIKQGDVCSVDIVGNEEEKSHVEMTVKNGTLRLASKSNGDKNYDLPEKIVITMKDMDKLMVSGACKVKFETEFKTNSLDVLLSGAVILDLKTNCTSMDMKVSGAVSASLSGTAKKMEIQTSGAAIVDTGDSSIEEIKVLASGATKTEVKASKELRLFASGASLIKYGGSGEVKEKAESGASSIKKK